MYLRPMTWLGTVPLDSSGPLRRLMASLNWPLLYNSMPSFRAIWSSVGAAGGGGVTTVPATGGLTVPPLAGVLPGVAAGVAVPPVVGSVAQPDIRAAADTRARRRYCRGRF